MKFSDFDLDDKLQRGIDLAGFTECMPVQEQTFIHSFKGKDVYVQSQTGTGKTAAFLVTIFHLFLKGERAEGKKALIIAPTRELAEQIGEEAEMLGKFTGIKSGTFYGGVGYGKQEKILKEGVDIIIGTPGRLIDFSESGKINMKDIGILIIDEADRLFDMGFLPDLQKMIRMMPGKENRQSMLYSATLDYRVKQIAGKYMNDPVEIEIEPENITVENVTQKLYHVGREEKLSLLLGILKTEQPKNAIVFTNTKQKAMEVAKRLQHNGYKCQYIIGDLPQKQRQEIIDKVKSDEIPFLIATDVASRGLHINDLEMVINYDLPENSESYVHRIGRTARVGKTGKAISLVCDKFVYGLEAIEKYTGKKIPVEWADESLYQKDSAAGMSFAMPKRGDSRRGGRGERGRPASDSRGRRPQGARKNPAERKRTAEPAKRPDSRGKDRPEKKQRRTGRDVPVKKQTVTGNDIKDKKPRRAGQDVPARPSRTATPDERLAYYSKKYGEDFIVVTEPADRKKRKDKKGVLKKLRSVFKKKG